MFGPSTERRTFPGGLRAQLLLGLLVLIAVAFGLVALAAVQVVRQNVERTEARRTTDLARLLATRIGEENTSIKQAASRFVDEHGVTWAGLLADGRLSGTGTHESALADELTADLPAGGRSSRLMVDETPFLVSVASAGGDRDRKSVV